MASILVVEDDPIIRQTVEYALRRAGFEALGAADGTTGIEAARSQSPDLILLDLMLPGLDGYEFLAMLRETDAQVPVIMVTALDTDQDKVRGLDAGADDYVTKPFSTEELLARVRANLRRTRERAMLSNSGVIEIGDLVIEPAEFRLTVAGHPVKVRLKEFQLLLALAAESGSLLTRHTIARRVWGYEHLSSSRTIDVHVRRLRAAIDEYSAYEYIHTIHGLGYRLEPVPKDGAALSSATPEPSGRRRAGGAGA
ncbi:MAG: response regulator transcription factor [Actinobacteria bacterium]|nr:MAG: response regulator transcription factor [Actinomycetota bacterium]